MPVVRRSSGRTRISGPGRPLSRGHMRVLLLLACVALPSVARAEMLPWVIHDAGARVVLADGSELAVRGTPVVLQEASEESPRRPAVLRVPVPRARVPKPLRAWQGKRVELVGASGVACTATIKGFALVGRVYPSYYETGWANRSPRSKWDDTADPRAGAIGGRLLVGELRATEGDCRTALWARPRAPEPPLAAAPVPASDAVTALALAQARKTSDYQAIQRRYAKQCNPSDCLPRWEDQRTLRAGEFIDRTLHVHTLALGKRRLVSLYLAAGAWGVDTTGALFLVWELEPNGAWTLRYSAASHAHETLALVDSDRDDVLELLFLDGGDRARLLVGTSTPERLHVPDFGPH